MISVASDPLLAYLHYSFRAFHLMGSVMLRDCIDAAPKESIAGLVAISYGLLSHFLRGAVIIHRLRGIFTTALIWAFPWALLGATSLVAVDWLWRTPEFRRFDCFAYSGGLLIDGLLLFASVGALSGALFAIAVILAERHRTLATLHGGRMLVWGALGGAVLPLLFGVGSLLSGAPESRLPAPAEANRAISPHR